MPGYKDNYEASDKPEGCGHPNQVPFNVGNDTHVMCGNDDKAGCGEEWPK